MDQPGNSAQFKADLARLRRERLKLSRNYTLVLLVPYFALIAAIGVAPSILSASLGTGGEITLGLILSFVLIIVAILLTGAYLRHSERVIEPLQRKVRREAGK